MESKSKKNRYLIIVSIAVFSCFGNAEEDFSMDLIDNTDRGSREKVFQSPESGENLMPQSSGFLIEDIEKNSFYEKMGLKAGDFIKRWNGREVLYSNDFFIDRKSTLNIIVDRGGKEMALRSHSKSIKGPFAGFMKGRFWIECSEGQICQGRRARFEINKKGNQLENVVHFK